MKKLFAVGILLALALFAGVLWWQHVDSTAGIPEKTAQSSAASSTVRSRTPTLLVATNAAHGTYLQASDGMTLYRYANDSYGASACDPTCATTHPPYHVLASAQLTKDPKASGNVGEIRRPDGIIQVTYKGMPLYYSVKDAYPGNADGTGGAWSLARP